MKRIGYLYDKMLDKELIRASIQKALKHKHKKVGVMNILNNLDYYVEYFYTKLKNESYEFSLGHKKTIHSGHKLREIQVPELFDHIVQHIIIAVLAPIILKSMYAFNCGVIPNRGPIYAKRYVEKVIKQYKPKYVLKIDIKKYFHNIDTTILINKLEKKIKDKRFINLIRKLLVTANKGTNKGIPIGFYSSQWLANFYLEELDYYIKQELNIEWYVRYVDDLIIMGNNKRKLQRAKDKIASFLNNNLHLALNNKYQVFPLAKRHIDFVGYLFSYKYIKIRKDTLKKFKRRYKQLLQNINIYLSRSYLSFSGWLTHIKKGRALLNSPPYKEIYNKAIMYISKRDQIRNYAAS